MLFSKLLGGKALTASRLPRTNKIASHLQLRESKQLPLTRIGFEPKRGAQVGAKFATKVMRSPRQPRPKKGAKRAQMLQIRATSLLRSGVHFDNPEIWQLVMPCPIIGRKRKTDQTGFASHSTSFKKPRVDVVVERVLSDPKARWLNRGRLAVLEKRDERQRAWRSGNKSFFMGSVASRINTWIDPFPAIFQDPNLEVMDHSPTENASLSNIRNVEDVMEIESTAATALPVPISSLAEPTPQPLTLAVQEPSAYSQKMELDEQSSTSPTKDHAEKAEKSRFCQPKHNQKVNTPSNFVMTNFTTSEINNTHPQPTSSTPQPSTAQKSSRSVVQERSQPPQKKKQDGVTSPVMLGNSPSVESKINNASIHSRAQPDPPLTSQVSAESAKPIVKESRAATPCRPPSGRRVNAAVRFQMVQPAPKPEPSTDTSSAQPALRSKDTPSLTAKGKTPEVTPSETKTESPADSSPAPIAQIEPFRPSRPRATNVSTRHPESSSQAPPTTPAMELDRDAHASSSNQSPEMLTPTSAPRNHVEPRHNADSPDIPMSEQAPKTPSSQQKKESVTTKPASNNEAEGRSSFRAASGPDARSNTSNSARATSRPSANSNASTSRPNTRSNTSSSNRSTDISNMSIGELLNRTARPPQPKNEDDDMRPNGWVYTLGELQKFVGKELVKNRANGLGNDLSDGLNL